MAGVDPGADAVLTPEEEAAYQRLATRLNGVWGRGSAVDRLLY
ncbi:hypothetical protein [Planomonospora sp. ID67723]|nr:hypothetical protein [Planomonospora sp. ID67723]